MPPGFSGDGCHAVSCTARSLRRHSPARQPAARSRWRLMDWVRCPGSWRAARRSAGCRRKRRAPWRVPRCWRSVFTGSRTVQTCAACCAYRKGRSTMKAIQKIREEHRSISAVLHGLKQLARDAQNAGVKPEFAVFRAMIHYIDEFPEQLHHPKEDKYLFPPLAARVPEMQSLVDSLRGEHKQGGRLVRELERALV